MEFEIEIMIETIVIKKETGKMKEVNDHLMKEKEKIQDKSHMIEEIHHNQIEDNQILLNTIILICTPTTPYNPLLSNQILHIIHP